MTNGEAISSVFSGAGRSSDDFPIRRRFVYRELKFARAELIKQELNKGNLYDEFSSQTIDCLKLERVDASSCFKCETGIFILRSVDEIPDLIQCDSGSAITGLYMQNGAVINPLSFDDWQFRKERRNKLPGTFGYALRNKRLFLLDYDDVDEIDIIFSGHFVSPEDVIRINNLKEGCPKDAACQSIADMDFSCPGHLERRVIEITRAVIFRRLGIPEDTTNNAKSDTYVPRPQVVNQQRST